MTRTGSILAAVALLGAAVVPASAQDEQAEYRRNCTADYSRFCSAYDPGGPQVQQCFQQNLRRLSAACQATIAKYRRR